jgi:hypothetical protein
MVHSTKIGCALAVVGLLSSGNVITAQRAMDPASLSALAAMGAYLRTLTAFQISSETTLDEVLDDGQKVQYDGHVELLIRRPEITSDRQQRMLFYDGKSFTLWARRMNYYATAPAPPTLAEFHERLLTKYGIELPLSDLFYWGREGHDSSDLTAAIDVGPSQIGGVSCEHYAFRQPGVDWQVWIQQGSYPLPRKLVITTTDDPSRPQYSSVMAWNLAPSFNDAAFMFEPSAEVHKITLGEISGVPSQR